MKITLTITLFFYSIVSTGQWTFEKPISELNYNGRIEIKTVDVFRDGRCYDSVNGGIAFENEPLKYTKLYTFNDYYYEVKITTQSKLNAASVAWTDRSSTTVDLSDYFVSPNISDPFFPSGFKTYFSRLYTYDFFDNDNLYRTKVEIYYKVYNNDPGFSQYITLQKYIGYSSNVINAAICRSGDGGGDGGGGNNKPDLAFNTFQTTVTSECSSCPLNLQAAQSGSIHTVTYNGGTTPLRVVPRVKNIGDANSPTTNLKYFLSSNNKFESSDYQLSNSSFVAAINKGSEYGTNGISLYSSTLLGAGVPFNKIHYLLIIIDKDNQIGEKKEDNNMAYLPFIYKQNSSGGGGIGPPILEEQLSISSPYDLSIHEISGLKVKSIRINNKEEENNIINSLPTGFYIVKSGNQIYKLKK